MTRPRFHLAFPVHDLAAARHFYGEVLQCPEGRSAENWVDFDLHGHQIVAHLAPGDAGHGSHTSLVDDHAVPARHFGLILEWDAWHHLAERLKSFNIAFVIEPYIRFRGQVGEQATLFLLDPSGNALEFKSFRDEATIFAK